MTGGDVRPGTDCPAGHVGYRQSMARKSVDQLPLLPEGRDVAERIDDVRKRFGLSKSEFCRQAGIDYRLYAHWMAGTKDVGRHSLAKIAGTFPVTLEELMGVAEGQDPPYPAWKEFLVTDDAKGMSTDERRSLQIMRWLEGTEPRVWHYHNALALLRAVPKKSA